MSRHVLVCSRRGDDGGDEEWFVGPFSGFADAADAYTRTLERDLAIAMDIAPIVPLNRHLKRLNEIEEAE